MEVGAYTWTMVTMAETRMDTSQLDMGVQLMTNLMSGVLPTVPECVSLVRGCLPKSWPSDPLQSDNVPPDPF